MSLKGLFFLCLHLHRKLSYRLIHDLHLHDVKLYLHYRIKMYVIFENM